MKLLSAAPVINLTYLKPDRFALRPLLLLRALSAAQFPFNRSAARAGTAQTWSCPFGRTTLLQERRYRFSGGNEFIRA